MLLFEKTTSQGLHVKVFFDGEIAKGFEDDKKQTNL
jgi:hypothetical protein